MEQKKSIVDILMGIPGENPMQTYRQQMGKLLPALRIVQFLNMAVLLITVWIPVWEGFSMILVGVSAVCFFLLSSANSRYRAAGILQGLYLLSLILSGPLNNMGLLMLISSLLGLAAQFQEYYAHGEMLEQTDAGLAHSWRNLFFWTLAVLMVAVISAIFLYTLTMMFEWSVMVYFWVTTAVMILPELMLQVLYLVYISKMIRYTKMEE